MLHAWRVDREAPMLNALGVSSRALVMGHLVACKRADARRPRHLRSTRRRLRCCGVMRRLLRQCCDCGGVLA